MSQQRSMKTIVEIFDVTVSSAALSLEDLAGIELEHVKGGANNAPADECWIQVVSGELNYKTGDGVPTISEGWPLTIADGKVPFAGNEIIDGLQIIREGSTNAVIHVGLYSW